MDASYHYKVWIPDLGQYVAQRGQLSAGEIRRRGGLIISEAWQASTEPPGLRAGVGHEAHDAR